MQPRLPIKLPVFQLIQINIYDHSDLYTLGIVAGRSFTKHGVGYIQRHHINIDSLRVHEKR